MAQLKPDVLYYAPSTEEFYFTSPDRNVLKVHRVSQKLVPGCGPTYAFSATYPMSLVSLQDFKTILPHGQATPKAIKQIQYIKNVPQMIEAQTLLNNTNYQFKVPPYTHQAVSLEYMLHFSRLALVLEMGLGKTFIAVNYLGITKRKAIVLGPVIVMDTWMREIESFTNLKAVLYRGTKKQRAKIREQVLSGPDQDWDVIVTNFEGPKAKGNDSTDFMFFKQLNAETLIVDEASRLIGHKSTRAETIYSIAQSMPYRYLLSGTLFKGKPLDGFMPFKIMDDQVLGTNYWKFQQQYCKFSPYNKHAVIGYKNLDTLKGRIDPYMLTMRRDDCLDMPDRVFVQEPYTMTDEQKVVYEAIRDTDSVWLPLEGKLAPADMYEVTPDTHGEVRCGMPIVKLNKLRQVLSGFITLSPERDYRKCNMCEKLLDCIGNEAKEIFPWDIECAQYDSNNPVRKPRSKRLWFKKNPKMEALEELLIDLAVTAEQKEKCLIWAEYKEDVRAVKALLEKKKLHYITPESPDCEAAFEGNNDALVFVGQISKAIGLTLNSAKVTIYVSHSLELEHRSQSLDRNCRIGQTSKLLVKDLVHPRSVETGVLALLNKKEDVKEFMQGTNVCQTCSRSMTCLEDEIWPYSQECVHYQQRKDAEKKETIKIV
jgi:SNF2 family DNA or RNA helicase